MKNSISRLLTLLNQNPIMNFLRRGYRVKRFSEVASLVKTFSETGFSNVSGFEDSSLWMMWFQGEGNAPNVVRLCKEVAELKVGSRLRFLNLDEAVDLTEIPHALIDQYKRGTLKPQRLSNLIRLSLLETHGGTWVDSTVLIRDLPTVLGLGLIHDPVRVFGRQISTGPNWYLSSISRGSHFIKHVGAELLRVTEQTNGSGVSRVDMFLIMGLLGTECFECTKEVTAIKKQDSSIYFALQKQLFFGQSRKLSDTWHSAPLHKLNWKQFDYSPEQVRTLFKVISN